MVIGQYQLHNHGVQILGNLEVAIGEYRLHNNGVQVFGDAPVDIGEYRLHNNGVQVFGNAPEEIGEYRLHNNGVQLLGNLLPKSPVDGAFSATGRATAELLGSNVVYAGAGAISGYAEIGLPGVAGQRIALSATATIVANGISLFANLRQGSADLSGTATLVSEGRREMQFAAAIGGVASISAAYNLNRSEVIVCTGTATLECAPFIPPSATLFEFSVASLGGTLPGGFFYSEVNSETDDAEPRFGSTKDNFFRIWPVDIPQGANVTEAFLSVVPSGGDGASDIADFSYDFSAEDTRFAYEPVTASYFDSVVRTTASESWSLLDWQFRSRKNIHLTTVIKEIIDRADWLPSDGAINVIGKGTGVNDFDLYFYGISEEDAEADRPKFFMQVGDPGMVAGAAHLVGNVAVAAFAIKANVAVQGTATIGSASTAKYKSGAGVSAFATVTCNAIKEAKTGGADFSAHAYWALEALAVIPSAASFHATASLEAESQRTFFINLHSGYRGIESPPQLPLSQGAALTIEEVHVTPIVPAVTTVSTLSITDGFPYHDPDHFQLRVNSLTVPLGGFARYTSAAEDSRFQLDSLTNDYSNGKQLVFTELAKVLPSFEESYADGTFFHNHTVELRQTIDSSLTTIFRGRIREVRRRGFHGQQGMTYVAYGIKRLADEILVDEEYTTEVTTVVTISQPQLDEDSGYLKDPRDRYLNRDFQDVAHTNAKRSVDIVNDLFNKYANKLNTIFPGDVASQFEFDELVDDLWVETLRSTSGFTSSLRTVLANTGGLIPVFDDVMAKWRFIQPYASKHVVINTEVQEFNLQEHELSESTLDRYTAIELREPERELISNSFESVQALRPFWNPNDEADWTDTLGNIHQSSFWDVYRTFIHYGPLRVPLSPEGWVSVELDVPVDIEVDTWTNCPNANPSEAKTPSSKTIRTPELGDECERFWDAEIIYEKVEFNLQCRVYHTPNFSVFEAQSPIVFAGNTAVPNDGEQDLQNIPEGLTDLPGGGVDFWTSRVAAVYPVSSRRDIQRKLRFPAVDFVGTAYTKAGIENVLYVDVGAGEATEKLARRLLLPHRDIYVSGSLTLDIPVPRSIVELDAIIRLSHSSKNVVLSESDSVGILTGYEIQYGQRTSMILQVSSYIGVDG